ncbi:hypothetical protein [Desulfobacterium sp. N47]|uniref:Guanylate cyclase domain-containing protein n=1 Tax=uncultured Desulfobacterium sp. TaxID=201089 RepID=E1Y9P8_9BACT|nr:hypothetical protein N47_I07120 [uncultured Desulfobacterium sp.]
MVTKKTIDEMNQINREFWDKKNGRDKDEDKAIYDKNIYEERIVAYGDILGWSMAAKNSECNDLLKVVTSIEDFAINFSPSVKKTLLESREYFTRFVNEHSCIEFSFFSDSFVVSAPVAYGKSVFKIISRASDDLLHKKFLTRGGVTIGNIYHREKIIFGPALIEAVEMESKVALYPRFICSEKLVKFLDSTTYKDEVVLQDFPQSWIVNVACGSPIVYDELMAIIIAELTQTDKSERYLRKWMYMREILQKMYDNRRPQ